MSQGAVLAVLQGLVVALPLFRGGRAPLAIVAGWVAVVALLVVTVKRRRALGAPAIPGVVALAAFVALALATTVPLPPAVLRALAPATARLYADALPGWPDGGGWTAWRSLALDPYGVWAELGRLALPLGAYVVVVGHPWTGDDDRVFAQLVLALLAGGVVVATLGLVQQAAGVLPVVDTEALGGRASGPFVNPNHFAGWLEMTIPVALAYLVALAGRVRRRLARASASGRRIGVRAGRAWISALIVHQRRLWAPLFALAALALTATAHVASGSRAGVAALAIGLAVTGAGLASSLGRTGRLPRLLPAVIALALGAAAAGAVFVWVQADAGAPVGEVDAVDPSLASRLGVALRARDLLADHPLVGTGLGSWLHAFGPYQAPPADGGIWDHAHDDYLELAAETGAAGIALAIAFAIALARAARRRPGTAIAPVRRPAEFEVPEWREALAERGLLRWGVAGGVAAILVHSTVDFGLHIPAIQVGFMVLLALLVSRGVAQDVAPRRRTPALAALVAGLVVAAVFPFADALGLVRLSPAGCLESADAALAESGDTAAALARVHRALDRSPADREAHEMLATVLGPGPEGDATLGRAIGLAPWSTELRDRLAFRLWKRGERDAAAAALEESMFRNPYLETHGFLAPDGDLAGDTGDLVRVVVDGDTMPVRLAALDPTLRAAVRRGLERALGEAPAGEPRAAIVADVVTVLEAGEAWHDAAAVLEAEADPGADGATFLAHAARDHVKAGDRDAAERTLLAAVVRTPERGELYRQLAVDVYGARRDFETAERVLRAGERSAVDILPVYDGVTDVLSQREQARFEEAAAGDESASPP